MTPRTRAVHSPGPSATGRRGSSLRQRLAAGLAAATLLAVPVPAALAAAHAAPVEAAAAHAAPVEAPAAHAAPLKAAAPALTAGRAAWVNVSVATVWRSPDAPRRVDRPALGNPARILQWLDGMTTAERRALNGRADTQALLGDRVRVLRLVPGWARVVVPSQPSQLDRRGYPGWVPRGQLTAIRPVRSARVATVTQRTARLRADRPDGRRLTPVSFGTRLPVAGRTPRFVRVLTPTGTVRRLPLAAVTVHDRGEPALTPSRRSLVDTATAFVGLPYLWAGVSGFGLDCSGLTSLSYRVHGIQTPRDALPQSQSGTPVDRPRPGDLMFYATEGLVHHVSMYAGNGRMVHAPGTGQAVEVIATATPAYRAEYSGARRYLP